jgi:hypothetical protein
MRVDMIEEKGALLKAQNTLESIDRSAQSVIAEDNNQPLVSGKIQNF